MMSLTRVPPNVTRSTKLRGAQRSPEIAFRSTDFCVPKNLIFPALYSDVGTHWVALYVKNNDITYFDSFRIEHMPKEIIKFIAKKNIKTNIFRIQAYDLIMCRYFCIGFINFMFKGKTLTEYTNLFSPNNFKENDDIILKYLNNAYI